MQLHRLDPINDFRWEDFIRRHPYGSVFHSGAWLKSLKLTYGYEPVAYTTPSLVGPLSDGLLFCRVESWLTGNRLVSVPFSDHCEPLFDTDEQASFLMCALPDLVNGRQCRYLEIRSAKESFDPLRSGLPLIPVERYFLHCLDLRPDQDELFQKFDKDSVQRRIRRAKRAGLIEKEGTSRELLKDFYQLFVLTRRRHQLPPTPMKWFRNLLECMGDVATIRLAYKGNIPIAAVLTLRFKDVVYYKYGCSDIQFKEFGAMPLLLWRAIENAKLDGALRFDMGRTEVNNPGLLTFKRHWAPAEQPLVYWRLSGSSPTLTTEAGWMMKVAKGAFSRMPISLLTLAGRLLYRHFG